MTDTLGERILKAYAEQGLNDNGKLEIDPPDLDYHRGNYRDFLSAVAALNWYFSVRPEDYAATYARDNLKQALERDDEEYNRWLQTQE